MKKNEAAYTASTKEQLRSILYDLINKPNLRFKYQEKALELAQTNHNILKNNEKFQKILYDAMNRGDK